MRETYSLIQFVGSNKFSGAERYALDICHYFSGLGWDVEALTRDAKVVDNMFEEKSIPIIHAPLQGLLDFQSMKILTSQLKKRNGRVILHVHRFRDAITAIIARKLSKKKDVRIVLTRHRVKRGFDNWLYRVLYRNIDSIIFVSHAALQRFRSTWRNRRLPFPEDKINVIHNSLYLPLLEPEEEPEKGPIVVTYIGSVCPGKGLETLIDALPALKGMRTRLRIVGAGHPDYFDKLRSRAEARGVMQMIDWKKHTSDPHSLIRQSHFGVFPSTESEAFGMPNMEFMYNGRPQISTATGGQNEYLSDGENALIVPPGSPQHLAEALKRLASDRQLRKALGENAYRDYCESLSWPAFAASLTRVYLPD